MGTGGTVVGTGFVVGTGVVATVPFVTSVASTGVPAEGTSVVEFQPDVDLPVKIFDSPLSLSFVLAPSAGC